MTDAVYERNAKNAWKLWNPSLDNGNLTLAEVLKTLPGNDPKEINTIVRIFENPRSPIAFKGAINLPRHDCVHIILGRGLLPQDEAFVIGFTMGTSKRLTALEAWLFKVISKYLYPHPYKFNDDHHKVLKLGIEAGRNSKCKHIYDFPFEDRASDTLASLRKELGINTFDLQRFYLAEREMLPDTPESKRLPI